MEDVQVVQGNNKGAFQKEVRNGIWKLHNRCFQGQFRELRGDKDKGAVLVNGISDLLAHVSQDNNAH